MFTDRGCRARTLASSLAIATALLVGSDGTQAQSFQGAGTFGSGSGTITTGASTTTIDITSSDAVINWTTNDTGIGGGPINFQPNGTTATFQRTGADFSVLNRIIPTDPSRAIQFNGTVISQIVATTTAPGGTVYFYSPGGVIVGGSAVFNVGNLGLTSIDPEVVGGVFEQGVGSEFVRFNGAVRAGSGVDIQPGATITGTAPANGSYLAIVAPRINNAGAIDGKRVSALVSADSATITFNVNGLFDIQIDAGTSATGTTLTNSGSIAGPAGDLGAASRIYLVAVPKNTAITMATGGSLGFDIADAADIDGNAIVLSGGFNVSGGVAEQTPAPGGGTGQVAIFTGASSVTSALTSSSTGRNLVFANAGQTANYASNLSVSGATPGATPTDIAAQVLSNGAGAQVNVAGNVTLTALDPTIVAPASGLQRSNFAVLDATNGGNMTIGGDVLVENSKFNPGGSATAGQARIAANSGSQLVIGGSATVRAVGSGGNSSIAGVAVGNGTGGQTLIDATGANTLVSIGGTAQLQSFGFSGDALVAGALPGVGTGGDARITATNGGLVAVAGNADLNVFGGPGAPNLVPGTDGSNGVGGTTFISQNTGGRITVGGDALLFATGFGEENNGGGDLTAGSGTGGDARIAVNDPGGISITGNATVRADGVGGDGLAFGATGVAGVGGQGTGGLANIGSVNGANVVGGNALVTTQGFGGNAVGQGAGGGGTGGNSIIGVIPGTNGSITIGNGGSSTLTSIGIGGSGAGGGPGGTGTGGISQIFAQGGIVTISDSIVAHAIGIGGSAEDGLAGNGVGGFALLLGQNGSQLRFTNPGLSISASGSATGGSASGNGNGGDAISGRAEALVNASTLAVSGSLDLTSSATGGDGFNGGNALQSTTNTNPPALLHARNGTITVAGTTTLGSSATGGNGRNGGNGGSATSGSSIVDAENLVAGPSNITLNGAAIIDSSAFGGDGGAGTGGGNGGNGGNATAGQTQLFGDAGNGTLVVGGQGLLNALAVGGDGGAGGSSSGVGGNGGAGGTATGGFIQLGTRSGIDTGTVNTGSATFNSVIQAVADASGGIGGDGGTGGTGTGFGGPGGSALGGGAGLLARGSSVTATASSINLSGNALGGDGGAGATQGVGGSATVGGNGGVFITATSRFQQPTQRGSLSAVGIFGSAEATGGAGSVPGAAIIGNQPISVLFDGADGNVDTISLDASGAIVSATVPGQFAIINGTLNVSDTLSLSTSGDLAVTLDTSTVNVANLALSARTFVLSGPLDSTRYGTFNVSDGLALASLGDVLINANFAADFGAALDVNGSLLVGSLDFDGGVEIDATGGIATRAITANGTIDLTSGTNTVTGALTATDSVFVNSAGDLIVAGPVSAGLVNPLPNAPDGYAIGLRSLTSVVAGNLAAAGNVGLASPGTIQVGTIAGGVHVLALAGTGFTSGAITTPQPTTGTIPQTYIANFSMETLGGQIGPNFNPLPIFAITTPIVAINGPVAINGAVATGSIRAASASTVAVGGPISTSFSVGLNGAQGISIGTTANSAFTPAAIAAGIGVNLTSTAGAVRAGAITAGDSVGVTGFTGVTLGDVSAGAAQAVNFNNYKLFITSNSGAVTTGALFARNDLGVQASGTLTTGVLRGRDVLLLVGGAVSTGGITAVPNAQQPTQPSGRIYLGNFSMATPTVNVTQQFTTQGILNLFNRIPVKIAGAVTIGNSSGGRSLTAATTQNFTAGTIALAPSQFFDGLQVDASGTIVVNGAWSADFMTLRSNDIDIPANSSLAGFVELISTNTAMAAIGDFSATAPNQPASGAYRLTDAEFDRISGGFDFEALDTSAAVDLLIGDLSVDATKFNRSSDGGEISVYADDGNDDYVGRIRIDGNVAVTGATRDSSGEENFGIDFFAKSFELNAATGSLTIADAQGGLAGRIEIEADNIHVASDDILLKLRDDPFYEGHVRELNAPARVQRSEGVLRSRVLELEGNDTIYIQNTGTGAVPAGFVTRLDSGDDEEGTSIGPEEGEPDDDGYKIVVNGQIETDTGTLTGAQAFQAAIDGARADAAAENEEFAAGLDADSTFNNCVILSGVCSVSSSRDPVASLSSEITVVTSATLDDSPVAPAADDADEGDDGSSDDQDEDSATDEGSSPIAPPTPLINTRALDGNVDVVEPVSGAGNPALFGSAVDETTTQEGTS